MNINKKIGLFVCRCDLYSGKEVLGAVLTGILKIRKKLGYTFELELPIDVEIIKSETEEEGKLFFFKTTKKVVYYTYVLVFENELSETQLTLWRMFKTGWYIRDTW